MRCGRRDVSSVIRRSLTVVSIALLTSSCADGARSGRSADGPTVERRSGRRELTRQARLEYAIHGRPFPLPVVAGSVAGHPTLLLVDTGANSHVIATWLTRTLGLPLRELGDRGRDHVGKAIPTFRVDNPRLTIDGWGALSATSALATEFPATLERLGIGGFVSPQRLDEGGDAVVVDLARGELRSSVWDVALRELEDRGALLVGPDQAQTCEDTDGTTKGVAFVVRATVEEQEVQLLLDTGAPHSDVFARSRAGRYLASRSVPTTEHVYSASGEIRARTVKGARLRAGAYDTSIDLDLIDGAPDGTCARDGVIAMDVLRSCAVLLGTGGSSGARARVHARCAVGPSRPGGARDVSAR